MPVDFDDMTNRILDKLDHYEDKIEELCNRLMKVEVELNAHFERIERKRKGKDRKFYLIIAGMGIIFTTITFIQGHLHG